MLIEHIVFAPKAENALVRLAMVMEIYEHQRYRVFQGVAETLKLLRAAKRSAEPKVRQQLEIFRDQLTQEHKQAFLEVRLDLWALPTLSTTNNVHSFEKLMLTPEKKPAVRIYRGVKVA